jgi:hypothetical protein
MIENVFSPVFSIPAVSFLTFYIKEMWLVTSCFLFIFLKPNNFVEVSGHNLESSQTWGFRIQWLHDKPASNHFVQGGGGLNPLAEVTMNSKGGNSFVLLYQLRPRIRPLDKNRVNLLLFPLYDTYNLCLVHSIVLEIEVEWAHSVCSFSTTKVCIIMHPILQVLQHNGGLCNGCITKRIVL